jgi:hypothetical protein
MAISHVSPLPQYCLSPLNDYLYEDTVEEANLVTSSSGSYGIFS